MLLNFCSTKNTNNIAKTLSNFHSPVIELGGILQKQKDEDGGREPEQTPADVPEQQKEHCENFHWIDKGNANEAKFKSDCESKTHGWAPKVAHRLFNMTINNAFKMHECFCAEEGQMSSDMGQCVQELATSLLNEGPPMRRRHHREERFDQMLKICSHQLHKEEIILRHQTEVPEHQMQHQKGQLSSIRRESLIK